ASDVDDIIDDVYKQLRHRYNSYPGQPWQRTWWFDLEHRQRFLVGRSLKVIATRSWPALPYVHPTMLRLALSTPLAILSDRKVQVELTRRKFPGLAQLPLAGNI